MPELTLAGCGSRPLAGYLKALGLLRVVGRQADPEARGRWSGHRFVLASALGDEDLAGFLLDRYRPSPVVSPWNGGSGFFPKDRKEAIAAIEGSEDPRLASYRETIAAARTVLQSRGLTERPAPSEKPGLLRDLRKALPDDVIGWLDTAVVLTGRGVGYPPLLGSGGNDGRFDFSNNYAGAVAAVIADPSPSARGRSADLLRAALWNAPTPLEAKLSLAHFARDFSPVNSPTGEADSLGNLWDLILALEGTLVLCAGAARRHGWELDTRLVAPFTAQATGAGYGSAIGAERGRAELWLPLWERGATLEEVELLAREARAQVGRREARSGLDFVRAAGELGVARGIASFERYALLERAGQSTLAVPAGRIEVAPRPAVQALQSLDAWLTRVRGFARGDTCPRRVRRSAEALERAAFRFAATGLADDARRVLERIGDLEDDLARSAGRALDAGLRPARLPGSPWIAAAYDGTPEFALAVGLASLADREPGMPAFRDYLHGTTRDDRGTRSFDPSGRHRVPSGPTPAARLAAIHARRQLDAARNERDELGFPLGVPVTTAVLRRFALGGIHDRYVLGLAAGLSVLDFRELRALPRAEGDDLPCPALDALLLASHGTRDAPLAARHGWAARLAADRTRGVLEEALLRLRLAGLAPLVDAADLAAGAPRGMRLAAALLLRLAAGEATGIARTLGAITSASVRHNEQEIA